MTSQEHRDAVAKVVDSGLFTLDEVRQLILALMTRKHLLDARPPSDPLTIDVVSMTTLKVVDIQLAMEKKEPL